MHCIRSRPQATEGGRGEFPCGPGADDARGRKIQLRFPEAGVEMTDLAAADVRAALDNLTAFDFKDTPLQDAIDYLKEYHGIDIRFDTQALADAGVKPF